MSVIDSLPNNNCKERDDILFGAINSSEYKFAEITSTYNNNSAIVRVFEDALKIDGVRINVGAKLEQQIADQLGCLLMTAKISDLRYKQAKTIIKPHTRWDKTGGKLMSTTEWMKWHSDKIQEDLDKKLEHGIIATVGKHWIIDKKLDNPHIPRQAINYGWHYIGNLAGVPKDLPVLYKEMPGVKMIQSRGDHHDSSHTDYSQVCVLVARECVVNGKAMDLVDVLKDKELSYLASHEGPLTVWRQPEVPEPNYIFIV